MTAGEQESRRVGEQERSRVREQESKVRVRGFMFTKHYQAQHLSTPGEGPGGWAHLKDSRPKWSFC